MKTPRVLTILLAGGVGGRLGVLTERRPKPALPFGGAYRLIDFALSNCAHSGLTDVWVVEQYLPHALNRHLANGRPWDLDRLRGGLQILPPYQAREGAEQHQSAGGGEGFAEGNADALWRNRALIREAAPDLLLVLSADAVYRMDYRDILAAHADAGPETAVTMATTRVPRDEARRYGNVRADTDGRVTGFAYKPDEPATNIATAEVFVYDAPRLLETLDRLAADSEGGALRDFGHELIPHFVEAGAAREWRHEGYWRDVGTVESYVAAHRELLSHDPPFCPDDPDRPTLTFFAPRLPARIADGAAVSDSLVAPGCVIAAGARVVRSVLGPGVVVEDGAVIEDAVLLGEARVGSGATVRRAIVDEAVEIGGGATVGGGDEDAGTTVIGYGARVASGAAVLAGTEVPCGAGDGGGATGLR